MYRRHTKHGERRTRPAASNWLAALLLLATSGGCLQDAGHPVTMQGGTPLRASGGLPGEDPAALRAWVTSIDAELREAIRRLDQRLDATGVAIQRLGRQVRTLSGATRRNTSDLNAQSDTLAVAQAELNTIRRRLVELSGANSIQPVTAPAWHTLPPAASGSDPVLRRNWPLSALGVSSSTPVTGALLLDLVVAVPPSDGSDGRPVPLRLCAGGGTAGQSNWPQQRSSGTSGCTTLTPADDTGPLHSTGETLHMTLFAPVIDAQTFSVTVSRPAADPPESLPDKPLARPWIHLRPFAWISATPQGAPGATQFD